MLHDYIYIISLIEMSENLKVRIVKGYQVDSFWIKTLVILYKEILYDDENVVKLSFMLKKKVL